jgi:hypothetical protein
MLVSSVFVIWRDRPSGRLAHMVAVVWQKTKACKLPLRFVTSPIVRGLAKQIMLVSGYKIKVYYYRLLAFNLHRKY